MKRTRKKTINLNRRESYRISDQRYLTNVREEIACGLYGTSLYYPLNFSINLKPIFKISRTLQHKLHKRNNLPDVTLSALAPGVHSGDDGSFFAWVQTCGTSWGIQPFVATVTKSYLHKQKWNQFVIRALFTDNALLQRLIHIIFPCHSNLNCMWTRVLTFFSALFLQAGRY